MSRRKKEREIAREDIELVRERGRQDGGRRGQDRGRRRQDRGRGKQQIKYRSEAVTGIDSCLQEDRAKDK